MFPIVRFENRSATLSSTAKSSFCHCRSAIQEYAVWLSSLVAAQAFIQEVVGNAEGIVRALHRFVLRARNGFFEKGW
jgi:hypothetical protein